MSAVTKVTKHFTTQRVEITNTCSYIPFHLSVELCGLTLTRHVLSYSSHDFIGSELRRMNLIGRSSTQPLIYLLAECVVLSTLSRDQLTRVIQLEKFLYFPKVLEASLLLALYWLFSCGLNKKHLKVSCLNCTTKELMQLLLWDGIALINELGSQDSYAF
jgi:hypothetical protein